MSFSPTPIKLLRRLRSFSCSRGVSIVEAALVTLGFLVVLFAIMEGGRFMSIQQTVTDAAREGARLAIAPASQSFTLPNDTQIQNRVNLFLESNGVPTSGAKKASVTISRNVAVGSGPDRFTQVVVRYPYQLLSLAMFSNLKVTIRGASRMRNETSP